MTVMWIAHKGVAVADADEDQTELLRRLTDRYGVENALSFELTKREVGPGMYDLNPRAS